MTEIVIYESECKVKRVRGLNPSKATRQLLSDYLECGQNDVFVPLKRGIFEPDFNPLEFETKTTVLCSETGVRSGGYPDIQILDAKKGVKRESIPVLPFENGELCKQGASS